MQDIIFTKYSLDRDDRFKIRTDIILDDSGRKVVKKTAFTSDAKNHIENIYQIYQALCRHFEGTEIKINECVYKNDELEFSFLNGKTFEEVLDEELEQGNINRVLEKIDEYSQLARTASHTGFEQSEDFVKIFGNYSFDDSTKFVSVANVDMLFKNILINESWNIIDYEWTFLFDVPVDFIIYRAVSNYISGMAHFNAREELFKIGISKITGIKEEDLEIYRKMDESLSAYVIGRTLTGTEMQKLIGKPVVNMRDRLAEYLHEVDRRKIQVFYDYGAGFSEENSVKIMPPQDKKKWFEEEIQIPEGCKSLRIDPMSGYGYLELDEILLDGKTVDFDINGEIFDNMIVFDNDDPQIVIKDALNCKRLYLKWRAILADGATLSGIIKKYNELQNEITRLKKNIDLNDDSEKEEILADDEISEKDCRVDNIQPQPVPSSKFIHRIGRFIKYLYRNGFRATTSLIKQRLQARKESKFQKEPLKLRDVPSELKSNECALKKVKKKAGKPRSIAIHLHLFYLDLLPEFVWYLNNMPYSFDLFISCQVGAPVEMIQNTVKGIKKVRQITVRECENRGRDIAPLYVWFRDEIQNYDYFLHIHSKKSLHAGSEKIEWRQMSLDSLLGSKELIKKIFGLLDTDEKIGLIYPEFTDDFCNYDPSWLRNEVIGKEFLARLNIEQDRKIFFFPAGSFFWAKTDAVRPLFDIKLTIEDFPEEQGQVDSTLAHVLERAIACVAEDRGYGGALIDLEAGIVKLRRSFKLFRDYLNYTVESAHDELKMYGILSFDVFGTLITSKAYNQTTFYQYIEKNHSDVILPEYEYVKTRKDAEKSAIKEYGDSTKLTDIYEYLAETLKLDSEIAKKIMEYEIEALVELSIPRKDMLHIYESMAYRGKKLVIIEDTYYPSEVIKRVLRHCGYMVFQDMWISCEISKRKDTGELWDAFFEKYSQENLVHIGDNPSSDWYRLYGRAPVFWVMSGFDEFCMSQLHEEYSYLMNGDYDDAMQLGELVNEKYFNSPFALLVYEENEL